MYFRHTPEIWQDYPQLAAMAIFADGIDAHAAVDDRLAGYLAHAEAAAGASEAALPPIQAWRRAFARMGMKPTQYRCASEALLRRYRRDRVLPRVHPLVDLCNAVPTR